MTNTSSDAAAAVPATPLRTAESARLFLRFAAASGFVVVGLGAFGAHGLRSMLDAARLGTWETAVQYQMLHVVALLAVGLLSLRANLAVLRWSGWSFVLGTLLFSGSLYVLAITGVRWLGMITPLGGLCFLLGWALLFKAAASPPVTSTTHE
jgi:uncharacterized membrane protein YgdD (TMEM256/DUF423 family)